jgi:hypothetical protein
MGGVRPPTAAGTIYPGSPDRLTCVVDKLHGCQYTPEEYEHRFGFGHSSTEHVATFARKARADRVLLLHHDPMHTDGELDAILDAFVERWGGEPERCLSTSADGRSGSVARCDQGFSSAATLKRDRGRPSL